MSPEVDILQDGKFEGCTPQDLSDEDLSLVGILSGQHDYELISAEQRRRNQISAKRRNERLQRWAVRP